ncbi:MAG: hypothetical protein B6229_06455 [Spirochaetaceae bacterium 4572_7]|nr:MAG: hypothetical protein B6229_06455 [Spirochaetaceae bacterium 4572_7]
MEIDTITQNRYYNTDDNLILMKQSSVYDGRLLAEAVVSRGDKHVALAWTKENEEFTSSIKGYIIGSIIQHFRELNFSPNLYSEQWAKETSIKNIGGRATEGMILCELDHTLSAKNRSFNDNYTDKFSTEIKPVAYLSYRAILLFYDAVRGIGYNRSYIEYRDYIINMNKSHGIKEDISFTQNGDVMGRSKILYIIKDNEYDLYK